MSTAAQLEGTQRHDVQSNDPRPSLPAHRGISVTPDTDAGGGMLALGTHLDRRLQVPAAPWPPRPGASLPCSPPLPLSHHTPTPTHSRALPEPRMPGEPVYLCSAGDAARRGGALGGASATNRRSAAARGASGPTRRAGAQARGAQIAVARALRWHVPVRAIRELSRRPLRRVCTQVLAAAVPLIPVLAPGASVPPCPVRRHRRGCRRSHRACDGRRLRCDQPDTHVQLGW